MLGDLATLADTLAWLNLGAGSDAVVSRLITSVSGQVRDHLCRDVLYSQTWTDQRSGRGNNSFVLRNWPVTSVQSVTISGRTIPQSQPIAGGQGWTAGWLLDPSDWAPGQIGRQGVVRLVDFDFCYGTNNVVIVYTAGYLASESFTIPSGISGASPVVTLAQAYGPWTLDNGTEFTDTTPPTAGVYVAGSTTPAAGRYSYSTSTPGSYIFSLSDVGRPVTISYSYVPAALEQVVIELVGERMSYRGRIGQRSKSLGGQETVSFFGTGLPDYAVSALRPYRDVVPLPP